VQRRNLDARSRRRAFRGLLAPSQGRSSPPEVLHAGNASSTEPPCVHARDQRSIPRRPARARPKASSASPLVTRGSARHLKKGPQPLATTRTGLPPRPSRPPAPSRATAASSGCGLTASQVAPSSTLSALPTARRLVSPSPRAAPRWETAAAAATFPGRQRA
jgi:hypothetical protein